MAKKGRPAWGSKKEKGGKAAGVVPKYAYFAKAKLASYPGEQGVPFYLENGQEASDFFKLSKIQKGRAAKNEEWLSRPGMGLALDAAAGNAGVALLTERFAEEPRRACRASRRLWLPRPGSASRRPSRP